MSVIPDLSLMQTVALDPGLIKYPVLSEEQKAALKGKKCVIISHHGFSKRGMNGSGIKWMKWICDFMKSVGIVRYLASPKVSARCASAFSPGHSMRLGGLIACLPVFLACGTSGGHSRCARLQWSAWRSTLLALPCSERTTSVRAHEIDICIVCVYRVGIAGLLGFLCEHTTSAYLPGRACAPYRNAVPVTLQRLWPHAPTHKITTPTPPDYNFCPGRCLLGSAA